MTWMRGIYNKDDNSKVGRVFQLTLHVRNKPLMLCQYESPVKQTCSPSCFREVLAVTVCVQMHNVFFVNGTSYSVLHLDCLMGKLQSCLLHRICFENLDQIGFNHIYR